MRKTRKRGSKKIGRKKRKSRKKFAAEKCSPKPSKESLKFSCYTSATLHKLRDIWNKRRPDSKITSNDPREIWDALKILMATTCNRESCWLRKLFKKNNLSSKLRNYTFAPKQPKEWKKNPYEWLSSVELLQVMKQYENAYPSFEFLGPSPIDYDVKKMFGECVWEELCEFKLKDFIKRGKTKIGIIFNLDPHDLEGSHWMCMFIDIKKKEIYYFDSYGDGPPRRLSRFMNEVKRQSRALGTPYKILKNKRRHQFSESECGMYCLYFIIQLLKGTKTFDSLTKQRINDKKVKELRRIYFNQNIKE